MSLRHEKGSFTGAYFQKKGKFEMVQNGTIFLDKIGEFALPLQVKILRFLQENKIKRAIIMAEGELINSGDMQLSFSKEVLLDSSLGLAAVRGKLEREYITVALHKNKGGMSGAARELVSATSTSMI